MKNINPHNVAEGALRQEGPVKPQIVAFLRQSKSALEGWDTTTIAKAFGTTFTYVAQCATEHGLDVPKIQSQAQEFISNDNVSFSAPKRSDYTPPSTERPKLFNITIGESLLRIVRKPFQSIAA